jgi:hypothetical protein
MLEQDSNRERVARANARFRSQESYHLVMRSKTAVIEVGVTKVGVCFGHEKNTLNDDRPSLPGGWAKLPYSERARDLSGLGRSTGREYWEEGITKGRCIFSTDPLFVFWRGTHRMGA